jgi:hypothetical protein
MKVILPYNAMVIANGDLKAGDTVRGYHYNEKKIVNMVLTSATRLADTESIHVKCTGGKTYTFSRETKVLSMGGSSKCYAVPFLMGVCTKNPRIQNTFPIVTADRDILVPTYELEWENDNYYLEAEGILVGSSR